MITTLIKKNGLVAVLIQTDDGKLHLMPPPGFILEGCIRVCSGDMSNYEWREMLKLWRARVTGDDLRS